MSRSRHRAPRRRSLLSLGLSAALVLGVQLAATASNAAAPVSSAGPEVADDAAPTIVDTPSSTGECERGASCSDGAAAVPHETIVKSNDDERDVGVGETVTAPVDVQSSPPDLQVTKSSDAVGLLHEGDAFLYTVTVTNVGGEPATGVSFVDVLPDGAFNVAIPPFPTFAGHACTVTSSSPPGGGLAHSEVACGPVSLAAGASASVTVRVIVTGDVCGPVANVVDVEGTNEPVEAVGPENHAETTDEIACEPRIRLRKGGPSLAHVGDEVTFIFRVKNTGGIDLTGIDLIDPTCDSTPTLVHDGNGDAVLAVGETWTFECAHTVTSGDGDPLHNVATVRGHYGEGATVSDTDGHDVNVLHPDIDLVTSATPTSGTPGTTIVYTFTVENTGDATLFHVSVDDDRLGPIGTIPSLAPGQVERLTAEIALGDSPVTNGATAGGADALGRSVSDVDEATVTVVGAGVVGGSGGGGTPFTGRDVDGLLGWLLGLLALGSALLIGSRRRVEGH